MLRELKTLIAVAQHGTFSSAGARIGLTQSAVSAQMQRLEEELGISLFDRTGRSAHLSEAGRETLALAEEMLTLYSRLGKQVGSAEKTGLLRIGAIASAQSSFLVAALTQFRSEFPGWRVRVIPGVSLNLLGQVDAGEIDLAIVIRPPFAVSGELEWHTLAAEPFVLLVPEALADTPWRAAIRSMPFIRYDRSSFGGRLVDRFLRKARIPVQDVVEIDELQAIAQLVAAGLGVALVPKTRHDTCWPDGVCALPLDLGEQSIYREIGLVQPKQRQGAPGRATVARRFAAQIADAASADAV